MPGPIVASLDALQKSLSDCYYFRRWQGNNWSQDEALQHIWKYGLPDPNDGCDTISCEMLDHYRPFVELYHTEDGVMLELDAAPNVYLDSGALVARFEQAVQPQDAANKQSAELIFNEFIDSVIRTGDADKPGLVELAGLPDGYLFFERLIAEPTTRTHPKEHTQLGDAQAKYLIFEYGAA